MWRRGSDSFGEPVGMTLKIHQNLFPDGPLLPRAEKVCVGIATVPLLVGIVKPDGDVQEVQSVEPGRTSQGAEPRLGRPDVTDIQARQAGESPPLGQGLQFQQLTPQAVAGGHD